MSDTPIADAVAAMFSSEIPVETIVAFVRTAESALRDEAKTGLIALRKADKRRKWDRDRKRGKSTGGALDIESSSSNDSHRLKVKQGSKTPNSTGNPPEPKHPADDWPKDHAVQFWSNYPCKVEKKAALAALDRVRRSGVAWATFLAGLLRYAGTARQMENRYIKHPTTWLNRGCWDDEPGDHGGDDGRRPTGGASRQRQHDPLAAAAARFAGRSGGNGPASGTADPVSSSDRMGDERPGASRGHQPAFDLDLKAEPGSTIRR